MPEKIENYAPAPMLQQMRRKALRVFAIAAAIAVVWMLLPVVAPVAAAYSQTWLSDGLYGFLGYICHQMPERSFHIGIHQFGVCSRCFGVYFGVAAGILAYPLWRCVEEIEPLPRIWLFASIVPIGIDWSLGMLGIWENNHLSRFVTGLILGVGCSTYIVPAVVEIAFNLSPVGRSAK